MSFSVLPCHVAKHQQPYRFPGIYYHLYQLPEGLFLRTVFLYTTKITSTSRWQAHLVSCFIYSSMLEMEVSINLKCWTFSEQQCYIPDDCTIQSHHCENLTSKYVYLHGHIYTDSSLPFPHGETLCLYTSYLNLMPNLHDSSHYMHTLCIFYNHKNNAYTNFICEQHIALNF
jgi:hypothetical protein